MPYSHAAALAIAKRNAFRAYETAVKRKRDTIRIVWGLVVLFVVSTVWEFAVTGNPMGPHWLMLLFIGAGFRAVKFSSRQIEEARTNLVAVSEMHDALSGRMSELIARVDEKLTLALDRDHRP